MRELTLYGRKAAGRITIVDDDDYELAASRHWRVVEDARPGREHGPYATGHMRREDGTWRSVRLHSLITGWPLTDHINHNTLDNRRVNLRPATRTQNAQHARARVKGASAFKGVNWHRQQRKWMARIQTDGGRKFLGCFRDEVEAAKAYDSAARELHGDWAVLNFPDIPAGAVLLDQKATAA